MGTRWQTERGGWRWGRQKDGEVLFEPLWGNVLCKRCLFTHVYRCLGRIKYVYMHKIIFLPHWVTEPWACCSPWPLRNTGSHCHVSHISAWVCSHLHFPRRVRLCSCSPGSFGGGAGLADRSLLSALELYPVLNLSIRGNELSHRHGGQGCCRAGFGRNRHWVSSYHL